MAFQGGLVPELRSEAGETAFSVEEGFFLRADTFIHSFVFCEYLFICAWNAFFQAFHIGFTLRAANTVVFHGNRSAFWAQFTGILFLIDDTSFLTILTLVFFSVVELGFRTGST